MGAHGTCCPSRILHPYGWGILDLARGSWSQVSFGIYLPMDHAADWKCLEPLLNPTGHVGMLQCFQGCRASGLLN